MLKSFGLFPCQLLSKNDARIIASKQIQFPHQIDENFVKEELEELHDWDTTIGMLIRLSDFLHVPCFFNLYFDLVAILLRSTLDLGIFSWYDACNNSLKISDSTARARGITLL